MKNLVYHDPNVTVKVMKSKNGEQRYVFSVRNPSASSLLSAANAVAQHLGATEAA